MGGERDKNRLSSKTKVLYIAGTGRSGSTLLERMLGQFEGFCAAGELRYILERGFIKDYPCGCGASFSTCSFWQTVIQEAYGGREQVDLQQRLKLKWQVDRRRHIPQLVGSPKSSGYSDKLSEYMDHLGRLYAAISAVSNSRVVLDSSKDPSYVYILANIPSIDLYVVHLVRDSRGHAYSWLQHKLAHRAQDGGEVYMSRYGPVESTLWWMQANLLIELLKLRRVEYMRVRYEELVHSPQAIMRGILRFIREDEQHLLLTDDRTLELEVDHTVSGNPLRFRRGEVQLRLDEKWKKSMKGPDIHLVTALSWPLLLRYGYLGRNR